MADTQGSISRHKAHDEETFEAHVVSQLVSKQGYRERDDKSDYNVELALDTELVLEFVRNTQPDVWKSLEAKLGSKVSEMLGKEIARKLKSLGTLNVLRNGVQFTWSGVLLCHFKQASNINPRLENLYQSNILSVMRQVHYSQKNNNSIQYQVMEKLKRVTSSHLT